MNPTTTPARRLPPEERRLALIDAAVEIAADGGYEALTLEAVAARAGVTRNLLYHYFPDGRRELYLAVLEKSSDQLTGEWLTDQDVPLPERLAHNFSRFVDHAGRGTNVWMLTRQAGVSLDPEIREIAERFREVVIANISLNHLGTSEPPPLVRAALRGYLAYGEAALDEWRLTDVPRTAILEVLARTLVATIEAAVEAEART